MAEDKKEKLEKVKLMLRVGRKHPKGAMRLGRHLITRNLAEFELNKAEVKELNSTGGKHWFMDDKEYDEYKKEKEKALKRKLDQQKKKD